MGINYKKVLKVLFWGFMCFVALYVGMKVRDGIDYHKELMIKQRVIITDPDYKDWEDDGWEERIYDINDLTE